MVDHPHHSAVTVHHQETAAQTPSRRPTGYTDELADRILNGLTDGRSIASICRDTDMPSQGTWYRWLQHIPGLAERYARAKQLQADAMAEEIVDIADTDSDPQRARNRIDARKWYASKVAPKKYGDQIDVTHTVTDKRVGWVIDLTPTTVPESDTAQISAQAAAIASVSNDLEATQTVPATVAAAVAPLVDLGEVSPGGEG